jgi:hypothetical protein
MIMVKSIMFVLLALFLVGCRPAATVTPREAFFQKHPELRSRYDEFYETSPEAIAEAQDQKLSFGIILIGSLKKDYSKYPDLVENLDKVQKGLMTAREEGLPIVNELKKVFDPKTDAVFWYDYGHGTNQGQGFVIVRNGDCYRTFWAAGAIKRPDEIP